MPTSLECVCCKEINKVVAKMGETEDEPASCITRHPEFEGMCLNVWVLQAAYYQYRQEHGMDSLPASMHEYANIEIIIVIIIITFFHYSVLLFFKEIQIYCIQATDSMVLGVAWP